MLHLAGRSSYIRIFSEQSDPPVEKPSVFCGPSRSLRPTPYALRPTPYALRLTPYALRPTPYALRLSNHIRKSLFGIPEIIRTGDQNQHDDPDARPEPRPVRFELFAENAPPKTLDNPGHGIEMVPELPSLGNYAGLEPDRAHVEPQSDEKRHDILDVAVLDIQGAEPKADRKRSSDGEQEKSGQQQPVRSQRNPVPGHESDENRERDQEINDAAQYGTRGNDQAREINLADHVLGCNERVAAHTQCRGEELPREHSCEGHDRIRRAAAGQFGEPAEDHRKHDHGEHGLDHGPGHAQRGLFIFDGDIAPGHEQEQLAVFPEFPEVQGNEAALGANNSLLNRCGRGGHETGVATYSQGGVWIAGCRRSVWRRARRATI